MNSRTLLGRILEGLSTSRELDRTGLCLFGAPLFGEAPPYFHGRTFGRQMSRALLMLNALAVPRQTSLLEVAVQWLARPQVRTVKFQRGPLLSAVGQQSGEWHLNPFFLRPANRRFPFVLKLLHQKGKLPHVSTKGFCQ